MEEPESLRAPCPRLALSRCLAVLAPNAEEQCQRHGGGGDPEAQALVSWRGSRGPDSYSWSTAPPFTSPRWSPPIRVLTRPDPA